MAKSRADGTPAKAGRKASPAKSIKASPAKPTKSKAATPERTTRSSPRRIVPSAKAQEAAADHVQTGRVAKKASPSKATTPAKKASPKKAVKATPPVKESSPEKKVASTKKSPAKSTPTEAKQAPSSSLRQQLEDSHGYIAHDFARYVIRHGIIDSLETADTFNLRMITGSYSILLQHKAELDGNARATDDEQTRQLRPLYRKVKKNMRSLLGGGLDECLKNGTRRDIFATSLHSALENQGFTDARGLVPHNLEIPRTSMPAIHVTAEDTERAEGIKARIEKRRAVWKAEWNAEWNADWKASGLTSHAYMDQVLTGRVTKPSSRAASRSRSPAKSLIKCEREASVSRPVRARSQSPRKAASRAASKSPAHVGRPSTRSRSPAEVIHAQPADTGRESRSKSPAKVPTRQASRSPAPVETIKTRARSPAKAKEASPTPLKVAKTRSRSPAKEDASQATTSSRTRGISKSPVRKDSLYLPTGDDDEDEPGNSPQKQVDQSQHTNLPPAPQTKKPTKKPPAKRSASVSQKSPSSSKGIKSASAPTASRVPSQSPIKESSPRRRRPTSQPPRPPHPNERGRDNIISPTNPHMIESLNKPNPFHETLPAPEIWHRRMPPYFPFGETPFMEREISRQIEEDLARGK